MLQSAYWLAKIGDGTTENEQPFPEIFSIGRHVADRAPPHGPAWRSTSCSPGVAPLGTTPGLHDREIDGLQIKANQEQRRQQRVRCHCTVSGQLRHELLSLGVLNLESVSFFVSV